MSKHPTFSVPLFNCSDVILFLDRDDAVKYLRRMGRDFDLSGMNGFAYTHHRDGKTPIMMMGVFLHEPQILAHEACHIAFDICQLVGVPTPNDQINETFCYLVQRIVYAFLPYLQAQDNKD
ncbi:hypothetical protein [Klebsiella sp. BIGb0407]|uniref:hypothetical protein n=1 Tax=Klebsiella sp. BIGb0407 TaxID=2940603 RepID=UPI002166C1E9|nr:hypothetical protein [Klebsiella sp. BIGb0407]MCS3430040.1 hypothetical protein [Klebsiella sp. BIGb0407]